MSALRVSIGLFSLFGDGEDIRLPRSLADEYFENDLTQVDLEEEGDPQDEPPQDPLQPPLRPRKDDFMPRPPEEPLLELPHDSIGGFFRTHFAARAWEENVWRDYLTQPAVLAPLGLAAGAGIVSHWDKPLEEHIGGSLGGKPWIGDATMATLLAGSVFLGVLFPGEGRNGWDNFCEEAEVMAVNCVITSGLKRLVRRPRPGGGSYSFPSGHTSTAFAAASLIDSNSGGVIGVSAYGLAGMTGFSRMEARRHYPSDVLAGAAIGLISAQVLDHLHWGNGHESHGIAGGGGLRFELEPLGDKGLMAGFSFGY
jgi:hypothetical protein